MSQKVESSSLFFQSFNLDSFVYRDDSLTCMCMKQPTKCLEPMQNLWA